MTFERVHSFAAGQWVAPGPDARPIASAISGEIIAEAGGGGLDFADMLAYARDTGGPALRALGFHDRARMLKALAQHLDRHKQALYERSFDTGATQSDHLIDIDGGIGTLFVFASKGRREMPDGQVYTDGGVENLSRRGSFQGLHIATPLRGAAVHINAFNFPVWGMLEKLAPAILGGMPAIVKPATASCYVTEAAVRLILDSGILPEGAVQMIAGGTGDLLDLVAAQDVISFTGSARTARSLRANPNILASSTRFIAEQDSLNAAILGPDVTPASAEFDLFVDEAHREMTAKAGQKCTAIRRMIVPDRHVEALAAALSRRLSETRLGDPRDAGTGIGALISAAQKTDVLAKAAQIETEARLVFSGSLSGAPQGGSFVTPMLFHCEAPDSARAVHEVEAFGPVATLMGYRDPANAARLANRGGGSLVASVFTGSREVAREIALETAAHHGRLYFNNQTSAREATGHGSPLPHMVHGGPGRAGGGEEMGGVRGVLHYMQRTAIQGPPDVLCAISGTWLPGAREVENSAHPFTRKFGDLVIGETLHAGPRKIELADIEHFADFTGDRFYAHMDAQAAAQNPFFPGRVAHGYLLLSFAAGLFVQPDPGPVLANTGLDNLRFLTPVSPGDSISVRLTVKAKTGRNDEYGEVRWHVTLSNQHGEAVAQYDLLTMNAR